MSQQVQGTNSKSIPLMMPDFEARFGFMYLSYLLLYAGYFMMHIRDILLMISY